MSVHQLEVLNDNQGSETETSRFSLIPPVSPHFEGVTVSRCSLSSSRTEEEEQSGLIDVLKHVDQPLPSSVHHLTHGCFNSQ